MYIKYMYAIFLANRVLNLLPFSTDTLIISLIFAPHQSIYLTSNQLKRQDAVHFYIFNNLRPH